MEIARKFDVGDSISEIKPLGPGFINDTFVIKTGGEHPVRYILQRKNHIVFPDVPGMMNNIEMVTEHLKKKVVAEGGDPMREVLTVTKRRPDSMSDEELQGRKRQLLGSMRIHRRFGNIRESRHSCPCVQGRTGNRKIPGISVGFHHSSRRDHQGIPQYQMEIRTVG